MPKSNIRSLFICDSCGNERPKWEGRCPSCNKWNTLVEVQQPKNTMRAIPRMNVPIVSAQELSQVTTENLPRLQSSSIELNRVLGEGIVPGSILLIAGDPGIGKSTLILKLAADIATTTGTSLYVTGEESIAQVKLRADRMGISGKNLIILQSTSLQEILEHLYSMKPVLVVVDSIQTIYGESTESTPGSLAQIKECTRALMEWAKSSDVPVILSGHVTKGGDIAGPRVLEHMVDVVLYMEGDPINSWRLLRTVKNRFGATNEVGVFEMAERGLVDVTDPSKVFMAERREDAVGSIIVATMEGRRPMLIEVQALTSPSYLPTPRRIATGLDVNRLLLVCAVLTRRAGISLGNQDVVVNVTGGLRIKEPAADLGVALAIASSLHDVPLDQDLAAIGEVGLSGEVRSVSQIDQRIAEVERLRLNRCIVPAGPNFEIETQSKTKVTKISTLSQALTASAPQIP